MSDIVTLADLSRFTVVRLDDRGDSTLVAGRLHRPGALYAGQTVSLHLSLDQDVWGDLGEVDPDAGTAVLSVYSQNLRPAVVPGASFPVYDSEYRDRVRYALDPAIRWTRTRFVPPDAFVGPATTQSRVARPGDEDRADGWVVRGGWDHEHCKFCWCHIEPGGKDDEGFVSDAGDWVCVNCHGRYVRPRDLRFVPEGAGREGDAPGEAFRAITRMIDAYDLPRLRRHLEGGRDVDARSRYGWTPLMVAASRGHRSLISLLLGAGADVNAVSGQGYTPLIVAAMAGHLDAVGMLLDAGATTRVPECLGVDSLLGFLKYCRGGDNARLLERLVQAGAA